MIRAIEESRDGKWTRLPGVFTTWEQAEDFIVKLRELYPLRGYRIVPTGDKPPPRAA